jgi:hypothetical protein
VQAEGGVSDLVGAGQAAGVGEAARVFLLLGQDGLIRQDYQLTVKPLAA